MWYVYILECKDKTLYTGVTNDICRRVKEHNDQKGCGYTRSRTPVKLIFQESCPSMSSALKREAQIKKWSKSKKLSLIRGDLQNLIKLSKSREFCGQ